MSAVHPEAAYRRTPLSPNLVRGLIALTEASIVVFVGLLIYAFYVAPDYPGLLSKYLAALLIYVIIMGQWFRSAGLYRLDQVVRPQRVWKKIAGLCIVVFLMLLFFAFALKVSADFSRVWGITWLISIIPLVVMFRFGTAVLVRRFAMSGMLTKNIIIFGADDHGQRLIKYIDRLDEPWNRVMAVFDDRVERVPRQCCGHRVLGGTLTLLEYVQANPVDEVLLALPSASDERIVEIVNRLSALPANVRLVPDLTVFEIHKWPMSREFGVPMINVLRKPVSDWGVVGKWLIDFGVAGATLIVALPLMGLIAICIKLDSNGPILFRQRRYGFQNQIIEVFKFRTMFVERADADAERLTSRNDPRVTRVGRWLRRHSLDELPQLMNVLKGDMSLVGPRPHALRAKAGGKLYADVLAAYALRMKVKPGITGLAQINGWRGNTETEEDLRGRVEQDLSYIKNWSVALDLYIILKTFWIILRKENSY